MHIRSLFLFSVFATFFANLFSQTPSSSRIYTDLQKFASLKKILYIAAHPDDENTRFLAWVSLGEKAETAYLSLTRGDGGQNLIGEELGADLGVLRTQELLAARSYDGAQQYFSRAVDFGYSKSPEETFRMWGKDEILSDVVLMIRKFQPDVIVTRFPPDERAGHGHHTASAMLAIEAFEKAADPNFLEEQVKRYGTWQTTSLYWNASNWWNKNLDKEAANNPEYLVKDIGGYDALLGMSYNEIGTLARSQHKCQGFGDILERGTRLEYFQYMAGEKLKEDFFEQNQRSWTKIAGADFDKRLNDLLDHFDFVQTDKNVPALLQLRRELDQLPESTFRQNKIDQCNRLIVDCMGLYAEWVSDDYILPSGGSLQSKLTIISRSEIPVKLKTFGFERDEIGDKIKVNEVYELETTLMNQGACSTPYWLREPFTNRFVVDDPDLLLKADDNGNYRTVFELEIDGTAVQAYVLAEHKWRDPSYGERRRQIINTPKFSANFTEESVIIQAEQTKTIVLEVRSFMENLEDTLQLECPEGWVLDKKLIPLKIRNANEVQRIEVQLTASKTAGRGELKLKNGNEEQVLSYTEIAYDHIPTQVIFRPAQLTCVRIDAKIKPGTVAYIKGVEDAVPQAIEQLGFQVEVFEVSDLAQLNLSKYASVVLGIRIYNVHPELKNFDDKLFAYVNNGGNLIMQYNTFSRSNPDMKFGGPVPFELSSKRVTEEDAEVTFLQPNHALMVYPNKLTAADFNGWVQERGLYFANGWGADYQPLFAWHDQGEEAQEGGLIVAKYGKGRFVYTGISFFRELPAGVEGAYRLFANLLSYDPKK